MDQRGTVAHEEKGSKKEKKPCLYLDNFGNGIYCNHFNDDSVYLFLLTTEKNNIVGRYEVEESRLSFSMEKGKKK